MIYYFTLPGLGGSDNNHWQSHFERVLPNCKRIEQENWEKPNREDWINTVEKAVEGYDLSQVVFISHSLGGITLAHWVKKFQKKIKGALIVAPPNLNDVSSEYELDSFLPVPEEVIPFPTVFVASANDPWASYEASTKLAGQWGSELIGIGDAGHINSDSGFGEWKVGQEFLDKIK
ncbi:serine hydrolase family protein [Labilibacter sediminis]|nr:serine hydrolase family protein [Labilibacter sediminis]